MQQNENKSSYTADMNHIKIYYFDVCYLLYCFDQLIFSSVFLSHTTLLSFEIDIVVGGALEWCGRVELMVVNNVNWHRSFLKKHLVPMAFDLNEISHRNPK